MDEGRTAETEETVKRIEALLPENRVKALSILLTATAIVALDAGVSEARVVSGLIASLKSIRAQLERAGLH